MREVTGRFGEGGVKTDHCWFSSKVSLSGRLLIIRKGN